MTSIVSEARELAEAVLADALPRRWAHTIGVAAAAERLVDALDTVQPDTVIAAAWLHDIGYAPDLVDTGFHPIDGAAHVLRAAPQLRETVNLIAHHSGAVFEAQERGIDSELARYRFPVDVEELAILNAADLSTSPDGAPVDPQARLCEILVRYPADHPVHRAVTRSSPLLLAQAALVIGAANFTQHRRRCIGVPDRVEHVRVENVEPGRYWRAVWSGDHLRVVTATRPALPTADSGVVEIRLDGPPPSEWSSDNVEWLGSDVLAATEAAAGGRLNWHEYRAHEITPDASTQQSGPESARNSLDSTFYFDDIARLQLDMAAEGRSVQVQLRTIVTLGEVTDWRDIPPVLIGAPVDLRGASSTASA